MRYIVQWDYYSSYGGPWTKDQKLDLDPVEAERINRSSPGVLKPEKVQAKAEKPAVDDEPKERELKEPPKDRQTKSGKSR